MPRSFWMELTLSEKLISVFVVLNLATVLFMNRPIPVANAAAQWGQHIPGWRAQYAYALSGWFLRWYAHKTGLDATWQMFGRQSRFNWWFKIKAVYADGHNVELPLPLQSPRTAVQKYFFDFREGKYYLNLYSSEDLRHRYARYLCRQYPEHQGAPIQSIHYELHHRMLLDPREAARQGTHYNGPAYQQVFGQFPCAPKK